jgi:uncharacterized membrane protein YkoI
MKTCQKGVLALTLASLLTGGVALATPAGNAGIRVTGPVAMQNLPTVAHNGSIQVKSENEGAMAAQARISAEEAVRIATTAHPGKVVETQLGNENGSLIWEITQQDAQGREVQLKLDAGNGNLLAAEFGDHEDGKYEDHEDSDGGEGHHGEHEGEAHEHHG